MAAMIERSATHHGGALDAAVARYGGDRSGWLDLSTGINPAPPPLPALASDLWTRLPERALEARALIAAAKFYGAPVEAGLVAAPGSQALISALPHLVESTLAAIVEPTYSEHRAALEAAGHRVLGIAAPEEAPDEAGIVAVVNPNNPDGRLHRAGPLLALADRLASRGGLLVVDEAFMDVDPGESLAPYSGREGLVVHRSFGKFFGYAGLRLGFALASADVAGRLAERLGPWAVSGPALDLAPRFMQDGPLVEALRMAIREQAASLRRVLAAATLETAGGTPLFALVRHERAADLFEALCRRHILTRPFAYRADWLRIGNPADGPQAARLAEALRGALAELRGRKA